MWSASCHSHQKGIKRPKTLKTKFWKQLYIWHIQTVFTKKWFCIFTYHPIECVQHQKIIKTGELGINVPISWTCIIKNISKNQNLYPQQNQITFYTLRWDTLYIQFPAYFTEMNCRMCSWGSKSTKAYANWIYLFGGIYIQQKVEAWQQKQKHQFWYYAFIDWWLDTGQYF